MDVMAHKLWMLTYGVQEDPASRAAKAHLWGTASRPGGRQRPWKRRLRAAPVCAYVVYGLIDPRTYGIRYVGQTRKRIKERLYAHGKAPSPMMRPWIQELKAAGLRPGIVILETVSEACELDACERKWIMAFRGQAHVTLLNVLPLSNVS